MSSSATPINPHLKRIIFDTAAWHERLEQLAEMQGRASASAPDDNGSGRTPFEGDGSVNWVRRKLWQARS
jgi:hypothetical protein